jgi:septum formation protein
MTDLILASASGRRVEFLKQAGLSFRVIPAEVVEDENPFGDPLAMTIHNARIKAEAVAKEHPSALVLGADTTTTLDGIVYNKPASLDQAKFSGRTHQVYTAVCFIKADIGLDESFIDRADVTFAEFSEAQIEDYFTKINPLDLAGGYSIVHLGPDMLAGVKGLQSTVVGLPIERVLEELKRIAVL